MHPYLDVATPIVFGHRGASGERPENTLPSFERALELGATMIETDVHRTKDGAVVVFHDPVLDRTTDGSGPIIERTLAELRQLDAGHGFTPDGGATFPFRGQGIRVPTLEEAFAAFPDVRFNVEIKRNDAALIDATLELVARERRAGLVLLAAESDATMTLVRARREALGVPTAVGASVGDVVRFVRAALDETPCPSGPMALQVPPDFANQPLVTPELVAFAKRHGVHVHVWTINERERMEHLLELGVDGIMSDFPGRLRAVVDAWSAAR